VDGTKPESSIVPVERVSLESSTTPETVAYRALETGFPDWYVSLSFGKSSAAAYPQAVGLAKMAPTYMEHFISGKILHQAVYSSKPDEYLQFVKLCELVRNWKACFVIINGQLVDRKIVGGLNYCYGDKCRSGNSSFCFGASPFTANPFGCHRFQTSAWNNPWWTYGTMDRAGAWQVDKKAILEHMTEHAEPYRLCPAFSWETAVNGLAALPEVIDPRRDPEWVSLGERITPRSRMQPVASYTIEVDLKPKPGKEQQPSPKAVGCGCLTLPVVAGAVVLLIALLPR
jgi:hypothetical protein